jgi:hypothetical protein
MMTPDRIGGIIGAASYRGEAPDSLPRWPDFKGCHKEDSPEEMVAVKLDGWQCERCEHIWWSRAIRRPRVCARCKSTYWDMPRRKPLLKPVLRGSNQPDGSGVEGHGGGYLSPGGL